MQIHANKFDKGYPRKAKQIYVKHHLIGQPFLSCNGSSNIRADSKAVSNN